jgi:uncharacterized protein YqiB (DUF1249 family)
MFFPLPISKNQNQKADQQKPLNYFLKPWLHHTAKLMSA